MRVCKSWTFHASHQLINHKGKCSQLHGHTYRVEAMVQGIVHRTHGASDEGMVLDFGDLTDWWKTIEPVLDHRHLNDSIPQMYQPTTAENIATFIFDSLRGHLALLSVEPVLVRVWETPTGYAEYNGV